MMDNKRIFIICKYIKTGGPRSLHQFGNMLISKGYSTSIYYFDNVNASLPIYEGCKCDVANEIEDSCDTIIVAPETCVELLERYPKSTKCIWWLSLYFYKKEDAAWQVRQLLNLNGLPGCLFPIAYSIKYVKNKINKKVTKNIYASEQYFDSYIHFYNCEYARRYLEDLGIKTSNTHYLCGPLESHYYKMNTDVIKSKKDLILINPSKSSKYILFLLKKHIKEINKNIRIVELKNFSPLDIKKLFIEAKLYIDLGLFPGPERMPREAVSAYCNVITSKMGAANNSIDVPIPDKYKYKIGISTVRMIASTAVNMVNNYENYVGDYNCYRVKVYKQIEEFENDVNEVIRLMLSN